MQHESGVTWIAEVKKDDDFMVKSTSIEASETPLRQGPVPAHVPLSDPEVSFSPMISEL